MDAGTIEQALPGLEHASVERSLKPGHAIPLTPQKRLMVFSGRAHHELAEAVRMVTATPARAAHLDDRGQIAAGRRADLVRVRMHGDMPVVRGVWRQGQRVS